VPSLNYGKAGAPYHRKERRLEAAGFPLFRIGIAGRRAAMPTRKRGKNIYFGSVTQGRSKGKMKNEE